MEYGRFVKGGKGYLVDTPCTPTTWKNTLFNDGYYMELSQTMQGKSFLVSNYNAKAYLTGYRHFYLLFRDSGEVFSPAGEYLPIMPERFSCEHGLGYSLVSTQYKQIEAAVRAFVPTEGDREVWTVSITNNGDEAQKLSLFSAFPFENSGPMCGECRYLEKEQVMYKYSYPYHVAYQDKMKVENNKAYYYLICDSDIYSYDGSGQRFYGGEDNRVVPAAVKNGVCSNIDSEGEDFTGAVENRFTLAPGETREITLILGVARNREEIIGYKRNFLDVNKEFDQVTALWERRCGSFVVQSPEAELDYLANYWLKKQVVFLARLNRTSSYCPVRNQLQDALGYSLIEPYEAFELALRVLRRQHFNGYLKQWYMTDGSPDKALCLINHSDAPIWLILCLIEIIEKCGDKALYDQLEGYMDSDEKESILTHLTKAAYYMSGQAGAHGLCLMLDGDWTDPINGAGRLGKGESTWNSMALLYCVNRLSEIREDKGLAEIAEKLDRAINTHCWDGNWYIAGLDDNGQPFGTVKDHEAKIFLNAQTWAVISGAAKGERLKQVQKSIETLRTPFGYKLLSPAFSKWNDVWGRISIKQAGTTENGSVYCHASMFKAFGDTVIGDGDAALQTILDTLPTNPKNPPEINLQLPLFVPNYYFGLEGLNFGRSSCHYGTGTTSWLLWVLVEHIFGVKSTTDGLKVSPCLPKEWRDISMTRRYRDREYRIAVQNGEVTVNKLDHK